MHTPLGVLSVLWWFFGVVGCTPDPSRGARAEGGDSPPSSVDAGSDTSVFADAGLDEDAGLHEDAGQSELADLPFAQALPPLEDLLEVVERVVAAGQRLPGWPASDWVEGFAAESLSDLGMTVTLQPVPNTRFWRPHRAEIRVSDRPDPLPAYPLIYNPGTPPAGASGRLVRFEGRIEGLGGQVVLLPYPLARMTNQATLCRLADWCRDPDDDLELTEHIQPSAHASTAAVDLEALLRLPEGEAPAAVLAELTNYWDNERFIGSWKNGREPYSEVTPAVWVRSSTGRALRAALASGRAEVTLVAEVESGRVVTHNVFGELAGPPGAPKILVSTHHDAPFAGGVEDASGIAVVLGLARYWAAVPAPARPCSFVFYFASAHFDGRRGTRTFVSEHRALLDEVALNMAFEHSAREAAVVDGRLVVLDRPEPRWLYATADVLGPFTEAVAREDRRRVLANVPTDRSPPRGDAYDFWALGIPIAHHVSVPVTLFAEEDDASMVEPDLDAWVRVYARLGWSFCTGR